MIFSLKILQTRKRRCFCRGRHRSTCALCLSVAEIALEKSLRPLLSGGPLRPQRWTSPFNWDNSKNNRANWSIQQRTRGLYLLATPAETKETDEALRGNLEMLFCDRLYQTRLYMRTKFVGVLVWCDKCLRRLAFNCMFMSSHVYVCSRTQRFDCRNDSEVNL